jgi:23S rRNA pseudouridine2605 synthase
MTPSVPKKSTARSESKPASTAKKSLKNDPKEAELVRLNVLLQELGVASRRKSDTLIEQGRVQIDGKVMRQLGSRVPQSSEVKVDGKLIAKVSKSKVVYVLHKPDKCLTSRSDPQGRPTIFDLSSTKKLASNVQSVGRLDFRSEGLLLLTDDGDLAYALTHPKFSVEKKYAVLVTNKVTIEDIEKLRHGVKLDDGMAKPLAVRMGQKEKMGASSGQWVEIIVTEGRNRLIRRMMEHVGLQVNRLVRIGIGELSLPMKLAPGDVGTVTGTELAYLMEIKDSMLQEVSKKSVVEISPQEKMVRKLRRKMSLNDIAYEDEKERRNAQAVTARRRKRLDDESDMPTPRKSATGSAIQPKKKAEEAATTAKGSAASRPGTKTAIRPKPTAKVVAVAEVEEKPAVKKPTGIKARSAIVKKKK